MIKHEEEETDNEGLDNHFRFSKKRVEPEWEDEGVDENDPEIEEVLPEGFHIDKQRFINPKEK